MRQKIASALALMAGIWLVRNLYVMLMNLPDEAMQGAIYRIMFFHIPSWGTCFAAFFAAGVASVLYLVRKDYRFDMFAVSTVEVGVAFTCIGLATGMIWGRISWGIWWTWDARLTWALITCLVYAGYLMLRRAIDDPSARARLASVLCIFAFTSVAITYKAIEWWRTQHPGPVMSFRTGGGQVDPAMESMIFHNWGALALLAIALILIRMRQEGMQREVDSLRRQLHAV